MQQKARKGSIEEQMNRIQQILIKFLLYTRRFHGFMGEYKKRTKHNSCLARNLKPGRTDMYPNT